jgi:hypothetical protein
MAYGMLESWRDGVLRKMRDRTWTHQKNPFSEKHMDAFPFSNTPVLQYSR